MTSGLLHSLYVWSLWRNRKSNKVVAFKNALSDMAWIPQVMIDNENEFLVVYCQNIRLEDIVNDMRDGPGHLYHFDQYHK